MKRAFLFIAAIFAAAILPACNSSKRTVSASTSSGPPTIEATRVIAQPLETTLRLPGELQPYESVAIFPKISGFVESIGIDRGSRVKRGQQIARLVAPELASQRAEAQSKVESAQSQFAGAQAKLAGDQSTFEKLQNAARTPGVVAGNEVLLAQKTVEADQAQTRALEQNIEAAKQALRSLAETEQYLRILAPFDGVITERNVHTGALVGPNQTTPMLRIETLHRLRLVAPIPQEYISALHEGMKVNFTVPEFPNQTFTGVIARISHAVDPKTRTMPVELDVPNPSSKLTPGTFSEIVWPVRRTATSLFVPSSAVATNLERTFLVRVRDGKADWVDVKTGASAQDGKQIEVFGNLKAGDLVAIRGTDELAPGTQVKAQEHATGQ